MAATEGKNRQKGHATLCGRTVCTLVLYLQRLQENLRTLSGGNPPGFGSWSVLVKWGGLEILPRFPVHRRGGKPALLVRRGPSIFLVEAPALSTSPNMAKSPNVSGTRAM